MLNQVPRNRSVQRPAKELNFRRRTGMLVRALLGLGLEFASEVG